MWFSRYLVVTFAAALLLSIHPVSAAFVEFRNCLEPGVIRSNPRLLQFVPLNVKAVFNTTSDRHNLNITIYGNVTGQAIVADYPRFDDPNWTNPNETFGKIVDLDRSDPRNNYTTLFTGFDVLTYTPYIAKPARFCQELTQGECPLAPAFNATPSDINELPAFSVARDMFSSYAFTSITATMRIKSGTSQRNYLGCIAATITPDLGSSLNTMLRYLPMVVLIMVGIATITAATSSPWSSTDIFSWSSNFGRDEDLLRLVTPGFGDCLQYIQFIILTGSLSLNYPGFFQPVVSRVGWSALLFNESFVTQGDGFQSVVDGVYQVRNDSGHGLDRMSQYIGMTSSKDMWVGMMVWIVVIIAATAILTQIGFVLRWAYRQVASVPAEDLRSKNLPFTVGNVVRIAMNYFLLPLVTLSFYQLVIATQGPTYSVALAAIVIVAIFAFSGRLLLLFTRTRPRQFLFDDLLTLLRYGPLYNTYCDDAATFALIPIFINILRGIAIGAVQPSGVAQVVLLAISEIILILTIQPFRPYPSATSMNIYHTCFAVIRLVTIILAIAFVPSLEVADAHRGWIGYVILLIHACALVFGFFLNAVQTLIEVIARRAGAGERDDGSGGAARGGLTKVFGMRQLSRRLPRRDNSVRHSMASNAAILAAMENEQKESQMAKTRSRSVSASSTMLLDGTGRNHQRLSQNLDGLSAGQTTPDAASTFSKGLSNRLSGGPMAPGGIVGVQGQGESKDTFYRPPRRNTMDALTGADKPNRAMLAGGDWSNARGDFDRDENAIDDSPEGGVMSPGRTDRDYYDEMGNDLTKTKTDYAVREVDFYYGVRGPALSSGTRKLKTGPADPTGPVSSATGWLKGLIGGKKKDTHKGFEVIRNTRIPPHMIAPSPEHNQRPLEPYRDELQSPIGSRYSRVRSPTVRDSPYEDVPLHTTEEVYDRQPGSPGFTALPLIDTGGAIEMPTRAASQISGKNRIRSPTLDGSEAPAIPRKSSRRKSGEVLPSFQLSRLSNAASPTSGHRHSYATGSSGRIPFASTQLNPDPKRLSTGADSVTSDYTHYHDEEDDNPPQPYTSHLRHPSSALSGHIAEDRPSSVGFVQHHRASDNIHHSPDSAEFAGSTAEVLGRPPGRPPKRRSGGN